MSNTENALMLHFVWGQNNAYFTSFNRDLDEGDVVWTSVPEIALDFNKSQNGVENEFLELKMPFNVDPVSDIVNTIPTGKVSLKVYEFNTQLPTGKVLRYLLNIKQLKSNIEGKQRIVQMECSTVLENLNKPLGIPLGNYCPWRFGDTNCKKDISVLVASSTIESVIDNRITLTDKGFTADDFTRGSATVNGVKLLVLRHSSADQLIMANKIPLTYTGAAIDLQAGCSKRLEDCLKWNNTENFGGVGRKIPTYHPIFEIS